MPKKPRLDEEQGLDIATTSAEADVFDSDEEHATLHQNINVMKGSIDKLEEYMANTNREIADESNPRDLIPIEARQRIAMRLVYAWHSFLTEQDSTKTNVKKSLSAGHGTEKQRSPSPRRRLVSEIEDPKQKRYFNITDPVLRRRIFQKIKNLNVTIDPSIEFKMRDEFTMLTPDMFFPEIAEEAEVLSPLSVSELEPNAEDKSEADDVSESGAEPPPQDKAESGPEPKAEDVSESGPEPKAEDVSESGPEPKAEDVFESGPELKAEDVSESGPEPKAEDVSESESGPETKAEDVSESESGTKAEDVSESGAEPMVIDKPKSEPEPKLNPEAEYELKLEAECEPEIEAVEAENLDVEMRDIIVPSATPKRGRRENPFILKTPLEIETLSSEMCCIEPEPAPAPAPKRKAPVERRNSLPHLMKLVEKELCEIRKENPTFWTQTLSRLKRIYNTRRRSISEYFEEINPISKEHKNPDRYNDKKYQFMLKSAAGEIMYIINEWLIKSLEEEDAMFQAGTLSEDSLYQWRVACAEDLLFLTIQVFDYEDGSKTLPSYQVLEACVHDAEMFYRGTPVREDSLPGLGAMESVNLDSPRAIEGKFDVQAELYGKPTKGSSCGPPITPRHSKKPTSEGPSTSESK